MIEKKQIIANGTYILRNVEHGGFLQYNDDLLVERGNCFDIAEDNRKSYYWNITYMGGGYYIIGKAGENTYLTCSSPGNSEVSISLTAITNNDPSDRQLWSIERWIQWVYDCQ